MRGYVGLGMAGPPLPRVIGVLVGAATLAMAGAAFADVRVETLPPEPAAVPAPAETPVAAPVPTVEQPPVTEPPVAEPPLTTPPAEAPAAAEAAPAAAAPAPAAASLPPAAPAPQPAATAAATPSAAAAQPGSAPQGQPSQEAEPQCVVTASDGSCALESTDCDILGDDGDNELFGTPDGEIICGLGGNDLLEGGDGDDTLVGGPGADRFSGGDGRDCFLTDDEDEPPPPTPGDEPEGRLPDSDEAYPGRCDPRLPFTGGGPIQPGPTEGGPGGVANVGALYVALTRYAGAQASGESAEAIALIATRAVRYSRGEISFLVTCSRAGEVRVTLAAARPDGSRVRLGATTFRCGGDGDDQTVTVPLSEAGRRLVESSTRLTVRARLAEVGAAGATRQTFVLP